VAFHRRLNKQGHTVLLTTHYLEEAEALCSRIAMLKRADRGARPLQLLKAASGNVLQFKTDAPCPGLAAQARVTGRIVQIPAADAAMWSTCWPRCARPG
jgi:ABC-2 type transport system ATP-binding protein